MGYDVWNEGQLQECFCPATQAKFREWLKAKYGTIEALGRAWHRYSLGDWESVHPPHGTAATPTRSTGWRSGATTPFACCTGARSSFAGSTRETKSPRTARALLTEIEWRTAADVDSYGYTWVASRHTNDPWMQFQAVDLVRAGSRGKPFWHAEATGGPLWLQPQVLNRPLEDGRSSDDKDVRVWSLIDMAAGATGILFTRWRPLLDGPLFGAFGPMGMDGSVTPRAEMASKLARWTNAHRGHLEVAAGQGRRGHRLRAGGRRFQLVQGRRRRRAGRPAGRRGRRRDGGGANTSSLLQGAYQAFFDSNIQADFVGIDDIGEYPMIYLALPRDAKKATADKLRDYVAKGGKLVSEGCPGYFGDGGTVGAVQPNLGLDQLFGARETYVQFTPDLLGKLTLTVRDKQIGGSTSCRNTSWREDRRPGQYANGHIAAVEHTIGKRQDAADRHLPGRQLLPQPFRRQRANSSRAC